MRIDAYNQISQIYQTNNKYKTQKTTSVSARDKVEISSMGKAYQTAKSAVNEVADVREDKIADIKSRIDNGTYNVSAESFADKLLEKYQDMIKGYSFVNGEIVEELKQDLTEQTIKAIKKFKI